MKNCLFFCLFLNKIILGSFILVTFNWCGFVLFYQQHHQYSKILWSNTMCYFLFHKYKTLPFPFGALNAPLLEPTLSNAYISLDQYVLHIKYFSGIDMRSLSRGLCLLRHQWTQRLLPGAQTRKMNNAKGVPHTWVRGLYFHDRAQRVMWHFRQTHKRFFSQLQKFDISETCLELDCT